MPRNLDLALIALLCLLAGFVSLPGCGGGGEGKPEAPKATTPAPPANNSFAILAYNQSAWPDQDWSNSLSDLQVRINSTAGPTWGFSCTITRVFSPPPAGAWALISQPACPAPYESAQGVHVGSVAYVGYDKSAPNTPANTAWHELVELMSDSVHHREIVDPVAPYLWGYVLPSYYQPGSSGPWDSLGKCPGPGQPAPGGFNGD